MKGYVQFLVFSLEAVLGPSIITFHQRYRYNVSPLSTFFLCKIDHTKVNMNKAHIAKVVIT